MRPKIFKLWKLVAAHPGQVAGCRTTLPSLKWLGKQTLKRCPLLYPSPGAQQYSTQRAAAVAPGFASLPSPSCCVLTDMGGSHELHFAMGAEQKQTEALDTSRSPPPAPSWTTRAIRASYFLVHFWRQKPRTVAILYYPLQRITTAWWG